MKRYRVFFLVVFCLSLVQPNFAQAPATSALPRLIRFGGTVKDLSGSPQSGVAGITFALYSEQTGGAPLWLETQNVTADSNGHYTALLGATKPEGLPAELFNAEQARWVGVQVEGQAEQPRVLLVSAPYALKAGDAETIGGLPPSAFLLAAPPTGSAASPLTTPTASAATPAATDVTGTGKAGYIPKWTTASNIGDSVLFQSGTGATAEVGIGTATPTSTLDVSGTTTLGGATTLPATGTATASAGNDSEPLDLVASAFNSGVNEAIPQTFQLQAEPVGNGTATASGTLNLLYGSGASAPAETGLSIASNGQITFAAGQAFPGTGSGTVTSVGSGTGLTGGPITGSGTLSLAPNACAAGNALTALPFTCSPFATLGANTFSGSQTVNGNVSASGQFVSTVATGTAPLQVTSTTQVANLNASLLGGLAATSFQPAGSYATLGANTFSGNQSITGNLTTTGSLTTGTGSTFSGLTLPAESTATAAMGGDSHSLNLAASSYDSTTSAAVNQTFKWQAEPLDNNTANPGGSLNLLFYSGTNSPAETGFKLASNGQITFATGQTFPGTGSGTVTSVGSGAGLTGGPITSSGSLSIATGGVTNAMLAKSSVTVTAGADLTGGGAVALGGSTTLNLDTTKVPTLAASSNTFTGSQTVDGSVNVIGDTRADYNGLNAGSYTPGVRFGSGDTGEGISSDRTGTANKDGIDLYTDFTPRLSVTNGGSVGIGTTTPGYTLDVRGTGSFTGANTTAALFTVTNTAPQQAAIAGNGAQALSGNGNGGAGVNATGGNSNGTNSYSSSGGDGVTATGGAAVGYRDYAGNGVNATGGTPGNLFGAEGGYGGAGVRATGGSSSSGGDGIDAFGGNAETPYSAGDGIYAVAGIVPGASYGAAGYAGLFNGDVSVDGTLSKSSGSFKIDHPLDPANKYLYHSFVESPDMMNIYNGNVVTDGDGTAVVTMPPWFEALNTDFRYQLTVIGQFAQAIVASEITNGSFTIRTSKPGVKVSWMVTGIRQDAWANAHRIQVEVDKAPQDQGHYIHPELFGHEGEPNISEMHHPRRKAPGAPANEVRPSVSR